MNEPELEPDPVPTNSFEPDRVVAAVVRALNYCERFVLFGWLARLPRLANELLPYRYVAGWLLVLVALLAASRAWVDGPRAIVWIAVLVAAWRLADLGRWWLSFLFDRRHFHVLTAERNLLFAIANLAEVALIAAVWLRASGQAAANSAGDAAFAGFSLVTQLGVPTPTTGRAQLAVALTEFTALLILIGGVAILIGVVQKKIQEGPGWHGR